MVTSRYFINQASMLKATVRKKKDTHQMMPFHFLLYWTANTISSANWPQNKQTSSITPTLYYIVSTQIMLSWASGILVKVIVICYFTYKTMPPLGVRVLIFLPCFFFSNSDIRCQCCEISLFTQLCWQFLSILKILRLQWHFPNRSVWSEAVWWKQTICHPPHGLDSICHPFDVASHLQALPN